MPELQNICYSWKKEHEGKRWGIFRWRNVSQTQTQDNFTCPANEARPFLIMAFYGQNLSIWSRVNSDNPWARSFLRSPNSSSLVVELSPGYINVY